MFKFIFNEVQVQVQVLGFSFNDKNDSGSSKRAVRSDGNVQVVKGFW